MALAPVLMTVFMPGMLLISSCSSKARRMAAMPPLISAVSRIAAKPSANDHQGMRSDRRACGRAAQRGAAWGSVGHWADSHAGTASRCRPAQHMCPTPGSAPVQQQARSTPTQQHSSQAPQLTTSRASSARPTRAISWLLNSYGRPKPGKWLLRMYHSPAAAIGAA